MASPADPPRPRRLTPDDRRQQLLEVARGLFAERPWTTVSTADVAEAAGVARSLVHHYFGGIRELFLAVARQDVEGLDEFVIAGPELPLDERLAHNVGTGFDVIEANRELWLAVIGHADAFGDPELAELLRATNEASIEETIRPNLDVIEDTPATRFALRCYQALVVEATRAWLAGDVPRDDAERLIVLGLGSFLRDVIPAFENGAGRRPREADGGR